VQTEYILRYLAQHKFQNKKTEQEDRMETLTSLLIFVLEMQMHGTKLFQFLFLFGVALFRGELTGWTDALCAF